MSALLTALISTLASRFSGLKGFVIKKLLEWGGHFLVEQFDKFMRSIKQDAAEKKVEQDVSEQKPRDEETKKNEKDWMNS